MPLFDCVCNSGHRFEWLARRYDDLDPECQCGAPSHRLPSRPNVIWSKSLNSYADPTRETYAKDQKAGGHWVMERKSQQALETGKPTSVFIDSVQKQNEYCRREGLVRPSDLPPNLSIAADGASWETTNKSEV